MSNENLEKLLRKMETDEDLNEIAKLDEKTKNMLQRIADDKVAADQAIEIFLKEKEDYKN